MVVATLRGTHYSRMSSPPWIRLVEDGANACWGVLLWVQQWGVAGLYEHHIFGSTTDKDQRDTSPCTAVSSGVRRWGKLGCMIRSAMQPSCVSLEPRPWHIRWT